MIKEFQPNFEISKEDEHNLNVALKRAFFRLSRVNSVRGKTVGQARLMALAQIESYLKTLADKKPHSPAVKYLSYLARKQRDTLVASIRGSHKFGKMKNEKPVVNLADKDATAAMENLHTQIKNVEKKHLQKTVDVPTISIIPNKIMIGLFQNQRAA